MSADETRGAPVARSRRGGLKRRQWMGLGAVAAGSVAAAFYFRSNPDTTTSTQSWVIGSHAGLLLAQGQQQPPRETPTEARDPVMPPDTTKAGQDAPTRRRMTSYAPSRQPQPAADARQQTAAAEAQRNATSVNFKGSEMPGRRAGAAMDTALTLWPGIYTCTLAVAVNSERAGPFFCINDADVKSPRGVTLMEKGSTISGSYKSEVGAGQSRVVSLAAWGITPEGVPVPLGASVGDAMGRNGMSGALNTHPWQRIGSAVFLLTSQAAISAAQIALQSALSSGSGNTYFNFSGGGAGLSAAIAEAIRGGNAIQNTVEVNPGTQVAFLVTEPVTFADAYTLEPTPNAPSR